MHRLSQYAILLFIIAVLVFPSTTSSRVASQTKKNTAYAVVIDNTASLRKNLPQVRMLGQAVAKQLHQRGPILLIDFKLNLNSTFFGLYDANDAAEGRNSERASGVVKVDFTENEDTLNKHLETLTLARGNTDLFGAIQLAAEELNAKINAGQGVLENKVLILITDGEHRIEMLGSSDAEDDERKARQGKLVKTLKASGIKVFAIGLLEDLNAHSGRYRTTTRERAESFLKTITKQTGGQVVLATRKKFDPDQIVAQLSIE